MRRYIAIDYGSRRIGLAIGDDQTRTAMPLLTVQAGGGYEKDVAAVLQAVSGYDLDEFIVGLPLSMDDTDSDQTKIARRFGEILQARSNSPVRFWDERLSTFEAQERLKETKSSAARVDQVAAQIILQGFLDAAEHERSG